MNFRGRNNTRFMFEISINVRETRGSLASFPSTSLLLSFASPSSNEIVKILKRVLWRNNGAYSFPPRWIDQPVFPFRKARTLLEINVSSSFKNAENALISARKLKFLRLDNELAGNRRKQNYESSIYLKEILTEEVGSHDATGCLINPERAIFNLASGVALPGVTRWQASTTAKSKWSFTG